MVTSFRLVPMHRAQRYRKAGSRCGRKIEDRRIRVLRHYPRIDCAEERTTLLCCETLVNPLASNATTSEIAAETSCRRCGNARSLSDWRELPSQFTAAEIWELRFW